MQLFVKKHIIYLALITSLILTPFAHAQNESFSVDAGPFSSSELDIKKALIYTALHYQWEITDHQRYSMTLQYKKVTLGVTIDGTNITIRNTSGAKASAKWLTRFEKLLRRQLNYHQKVNKAKSLIPQS